jgi:hypothetical protein
MPEKTYEDKGSIFYITYFCIVSNPSFTPAVKTHHAVTGARFYDILSTGHINIWLFYQQSVFQSAALLAC